jgi:hypothetical protein
MQSSDFDDLVEQAKQFGKVLSTLYEDVAGEELDLEGAIKHYPLVALGLALGAGAVAGWWIGRRQAPALPPPEPPRGTGRLSDLFKRETPKPEMRRDQPAHPLDYLENLIPGGVDKVRDVLPDVVSEEAAAMARNWVDTVLEPRLKQGLDTMAANISEGKFGAFFRRTMQRYEDREDHRLDDPEQ